MRAGKNPFAGRTGDFKRHYLLASAGEIMPYRMYVPTTYTTGAQGAFPLIVALHGLGGTEDSFFNGYDGVCRSSPSSTATSSPRRSGIASTARTAGESATRRRIRTRAACRSEARRT